MTALALLLALYGVLAAWLMVLAHAAPKGESDGLSTDHRGMAPICSDRLWWPRPEPPVPKRLAPALLHVP